MVIENETELMMILVALESASELILQDPRAKEWHERVYVSLFNKVKSEYDEIRDTEELINLHHEYQEL
jgi:hypothetical protein